MVGTTCVPKECGVANCTACVFDTEDQCELCEPNWKVDGETLQCIPKVCNAVNCDQCVFDSEDQCETCGGGHAFKDGACGTKEGSGKLPTGAIIGVVVGAVLLLLLLILLLLFFCCRKNNGTQEHVDYITQDKEEKTDVSEETEVTMIEDDNDEDGEEGDGRAVNPLSRSGHTQDADVSQEEAQRRMSRRARSIRYYTFEVADIDPDFMHSLDTEILH
ncbi:hypothetical protein AGDE_13905 [Angomonas deanei]|nr:hypothetical protein AGDE_13905 [Angomonas deanei]|eukprot:EPY21618.1 hypothetical protein AGDE_13905 [Angomonas deanei]